MADRARRVGHRDRLEVLGVATRLGCTSFGGPVAHIGYFRDEYVGRRRWLSDRSFADLVALTQALPGPASSQAGIGVGWLRAGYPGSVLAWLGFTLPSVVLLVLFAWGAQGISDPRWLEGLKLAAVAVVAYAVIGMARMLTPDPQRIALAVAAAALVLAWPSSLASILVIVVGGLAGWRFLRASDIAPDTGSFPENARIALGSLALFGGLLALLPVLAAVTESGTIELVDSFYRTGSLVFGGGHVVLPLLEAEVVEPGWVTESEFVAGYGAAQAVPGPLFTFAAYLGYVVSVGPGGVPGAALATVAIFLPAFLLVFGTLPFWAVLRRRPAFRSALLGINAVVVGLLLAALYDPVWKSTVHDAVDFALALGALALLAVARTPAWLVVVTMGLIGAAMAAWG